MAKIREYTNIFNETPARLCKFQFSSLAFGYFFTSHFSCLLSFILIFCFTDFMQQQLCQRLVRISCSRYISTTSPQLWKNYENERHYEPGEDVLKRVWHGLTYDFRRWKRRYNEVSKYIYFLYK